MAKYAIRHNGAITGFTRWPNEKADSTPVNENSREWVDYITESERPPTEVEQIDKSSSVQRELIAELDARLPGLRASVEARMRANPEPNTGRQPPVTPPRT